MLFLINIRFTVLVIVMTEENIVRSFFLRVIYTISETVVPVIPEFVFDSWSRVYEISKQLSNADIHYQVLVALLSWFIVNLILIKLAWTVFGEDNIKLLSSKDQVKHLKKE